MTELALTPLVLGHVAITLVAIASGLWVLAHLVKGSLPTHSNQVFLFFTFLTSATGFLITPGAPAPTPAQITGVIALLTLAVALYAFYGRHLRGWWRAAYLITAIIGLYLNVFVLVIQLFLKVPALHALAPTGGGPVFGTVQALVLVFFVVAGWLAVRRYQMPVAS